MKTIACLLTAALAVEGGPDPAQRKLDDCALRDLPVHGCTHDLPSPR